MSADLLREAAKVLRERAEMATPGTWVHNPINGVHTMIGSCIATTHRHVEDARRADDAYIATMHPGVGLTLADWFDIEATRADYREDQQRHANATRLRAEPFGCYYDASTDSAIKVARLILGREAPS